MYEWSEELVVLFYILQPSLIQNCPKDETLSMLIYQLSFSWLLDIFDCTHGDSFLILSSYHNMIMQVLADNIGIPCRLVKGSHYTGVDDDAINIIKMDERFALVFFLCWYSINILLIDISLWTIWGHFLLKSFIQ